MHSWEPRVRNTVRNDALLANDNDDLASRASYVPLVLTPSAAADKDAAVGLQL